MTPLLFVAAGLGALAIGGLVLRTYGPGYRIGRLLASTPSVSVGEALALADGPERYVAIHGRVDAEDEFEDDAHRPLVLRRARLQLRDGRTWTTFDQHGQAVPFGVAEGLDVIAVDESALADGLVVTIRESIGTAADTPDRVPPGTSPTTPVRLRVEQISSVEHAIALGVPRHTDGGAIHLTAGLGRPLVLTTLERDEAMRVLTEGGRRRPMVAAGALIAGLVLVAIGLLWGIAAAITGTALAATPIPSAVTAGDPRSSGQGPGLVGDPLLAVALVVVIGLVSVGATLVYVRTTGGRRT